MATIFQTTDINTSSGSALTLANGDTLVVAQGVKLSTTAFGRAVVASGNANITIYGMLFGVQGLQIIGTSGVSEVVVGATGSIIGTADGFALESAGTVNFRNYGHVSGQTESGIQFFGASRVGGSVINYGQIDGQDHGVRVDNGTGGFTLTNFGTISAVNGPSYVDTATNSIDVIVNGGTMVGDILLNSGADIYDGNGGRVVGEVYGGAGDDVLKGGDFADFLFGEADNDTLDGGGGDDELRGGLGNDVMDGRAGFDNLFGDDGNDIMRGQEGDDRLFGWIGNDQLFGDDGNDRLEGQDGNDDLFGWTGKDELFGGEGEDRLFGQGDDDRLFGWNGNDELLGGDGNDTLVGDAGLDVLRGGAGDDTIEGGADFDVIYGGTGVDTMNGGGAGDQFWFPIYDLERGSFDNIFGADLDDRFVFDDAIQSSVSFFDNGVNQCVIRVNLGNGTHDVNVFGLTAAQAQAQTVYWL